MERNEIQIGELRSVVNGILDFIERDLGIASVTPQYDHYWTVPDGDLYSTTSKPEYLDAGSLKDDWHFVHAAFKDKSQALPATLAHVAPLLLLLSRQVQNYK